MFGLNIVDIDDHYECEWSMNTCVKNYQNIDSHHALTVKMIINQENLNKLLELYSYTHSINIENCNIIFDAFDTCARERNPCMQIRLNLIAGKYFYPIVIDYIAIWVIEPVCVDTSMDTRTTTSTNTSTHASMDTSTHTSTCALSQQIAKLNI